MSDLVRHYTPHQAAKLVGVRSGVIRALVARGRLPVVLRLYRKEAGEITSSPDRPQHMIDLDELMALHGDPATWKDAVDSLYVQHVERPKHTKVSEANEAAGRARRAVDDLLEDRALARELGDW